MDDDDKLHDLNNKEIEEIQNAQLIVTEASQFIYEGTYSHVSYLLKFLAKPYKTEEVVTDDYRYLIFHQQIVMLLRITSN